MAQLPEIGEWAPFARTAWWNLFANYGGKLWCRLSRHQVGFFAEFGKNLQVRLRPSRYPGLERADLVR